LKDMPIPTFDFGQTTDDYLRKAVRRIVLIVILGLTCPSGAEG